MCGPRGETPLIPIKVAERVGAVLSCTDEDVESSVDRAAGMLPSVRRTGKHSDRPLTEVAGGLTLPSLLPEELRTGETRH